MFINIVMPYTWGDRTIEHSKLVGEMTTIKSRKKFSSAIMPLFRNPAVGLLEDVEEVIPELVEPLSWNIPSFMISSTRIFFSAGISYAFDL